MATEVKAVPNRRWYVIHTQTGQEDKVRQSLENKIQRQSEDTHVFQVLVPTEKVSEIRDGKKRITERKFFPGYVLIEMDLNERSWYLIKSTPGVTGFIGAGSKPLPLDEEEVNHILRQSQEKKEKPSPKVIFEKGEGVRIIEGPFVNFSGTIDEVNPSRGRLKVLVSVFGRPTPVELEYWQVEKL